jgi:TolA-binding protein
MLRSAFVVVVLLAIPVVAQPPNPLDLVRGLREHDLADLALEYLQEIEKSNPTGDVKTLLPLERAKTRLALARQEEDEGARDAALTRAKAEFEAFLKDNAKHPRAAEATLALARVVALEATTRLNRAGRLDPAQRRTAAAATRPLFQQAANLFGQAAKRINAQLDEENLDSFRRRELTREAVQAELDRGINQFRMSDTFDTSDPKQVVERGKVLDAAQAIFEAIWKRDPNDPTAWVARAWIGACYLEKTETVKAEDLFRQIRTEAARTPAAADGVRMVEFFEAQTKYLAAASTPNIVREARIQVKAWLDKDKYKQRMTPERVSALYYYAVLSEQLARQTGVTFDKDKKLRELSAATRTMLREAHDTYKRLTEFDNPYSARAAEARTGVIRLLVGNADQPAEQFTDFDQCQMAALVQLSEASQKDTPAEERSRRLVQAIRLLERCRQLAGPEISPRDQSAAMLQLAYAYLSADRPQHAAVLGEYLARHGRPAGTAARGGFIGVQGYLAALAKLDEDNEAREVDRDRAVALASHLASAYPTDPMTDAVRFRLGKLYFDEQDYQRAFDTLSAVTENYSGLATVRLIQGQAAYALAVDRDTPLPPDRRANLLRQAVAAAAAVPEPPTTAAAEDVRAYLAVRTLLAQLHLVNKDYSQAENVAATAATLANTFSNLDDSAKKAASFAAAEVRLRAVYAQTAPLLEQKQYKELLDRLAPVIAEMAKTGPANKGLDGPAAIAADALDRFRQDVITLALQGVIREGSGSSTAELFDLLEQFGGSTDVLVRLVTQIRPQIEELRRSGDTEEADSLARSLTGILEKQAANPKLPARTIVRLGQALRGVGAYDKAIEILSKVPAPPREHLMMPSAELPDPEAREAVVTHQVARLELARAYRQAKQFDRADEVLKDALGNEASPGWTRSLEYRKEAVLLLEDRAAEAPQDQKMALWKDAMDGWTRIVVQYQSAITRPPKDAAGDPAKMDQWQRDREKLIPVFLVAYADLQRCLARANSQLIRDEAKRAEALGKIGQRVYDVEARNEKSLSADVRTSYSELLRDYPAVRAGYEQAGGTAFLPQGGM